MRLIDADALRRNMRFTCSEVMAGTASYKAPLDEIDAAPTVTQWIPCSERLPKRCNYYIVTDFGKVDEAYYDSDGRWFSWGGNKLKDVTAWMPLPDPYEGGEQDEND